MLTVAYQGNQTPAEISATTNAQAPIVCHRSLVERRDQSKIPANSAKKKPITSRIAITRSLFHLFRQP